MSKRKRAAGMLPAALCRPDGSGRFPGRIDGQAEDYFFLVGAGFAAVLVVVVAGLLAGFFDCICIASKGAGIYPVLQKSGPLPANNVVQRHLKFEYRIF
ncbi:MAG: hypothetical protein VW405_15015 [Rhodospirillaceae bacterium]